MLSWIVVVGPYVWTSCVVTATDMASDDGVEFGICVDVFRALL